MERSARNPMFWITGFILSFRKSSGFSESSLNQGYSSSILRILLCTATDRMILKLPKIKGGNFMYQAYENAVGKINKYLIENHFSVSVMYSHLNCYRLFKQYLEENRLPYSHGEATKWLNSNRPGWKHSKFKTARLSLFRLNDVMRNGCITTDSYVYENSCNYDRLPEWCRSLLDGYLNDISHLFSEGYVKEHRMACSEFLIYMSSVGGKNERDITHKTVIGYYNQSEHRTIQAKNSYNRKIRYGVVKFGLVPKLVILENVNKWIPPGYTIFSSYLLAGTT